jgi:hypothetical protein
MSRSWNPDPVCPSVEVLKPRSSSVCLSRSWNPNPVYPYVKVLKPRSQIEIPNRFQKPVRFEKVSPRTRGPKNYSGPQSHTFTSLLIQFRVPSPNSRPIQVPSPNAQASNYLLGCLRSKSQTIKKNLARELGNAQVCGTAGVSIKLGRWRSPVSPWRPESRAINQALCHGWTGTRPVCFRGLSPTLARVPELGSLSPFSL